MHYNNSISSNDKTPIFESILKHYFSHLQITKMYCSNDSEVAEQRQIIVNFASKHVAFLERHKALW